MHHTNTTNSASTTKPQTLDNASYRPTTGENAPPPSAPPPSALPFPCAPASPHENAPASAFSNASTNLLKLQSLFGKFSSKKTLPLATAAFALLSLATYTALQTQTETTSLSHISRNLGDNCWDVKTMSFNEYKELSTEEQNAISEYACPSRKTSGLCFVDIKTPYWSCKERTLYMCVKGSTYAECKKVRENCPKEGRVLKCYTRPSVVPKFGWPFYRVIRILPGQWVELDANGKQPIGCGKYAVAVGDGICRYH